MRTLILALALGACASPDITTGDTPINGSFAHAIDGDTFKIEHRRYRLARIDAPEMPGHCRPGRHCVSGDPYAAKAALQRMIDQGVQCRALGLDYYRRTLVECRHHALDVGEQLIALGYAKPYHR